MKVMELAAARRCFLGRSPLEFGELPPALRSRIREVFTEDLPPLEVVRRIILTVGERGDAALMEYSRLLEGAEVSSLEVTPREWEEGWRQVSPELLSALELAAERVRSYHQEIRVSSFFDFARGVGRRVLPLERVGIYIPGGRASYPSTVLMTAIPARVAGVGEVVLTTPPAKQGGIAPPVLAAARLAGADRVFKMGGAQAIAALAFGTGSVPRVDKICGPGNLFVTLAKREVFGQVDIDGLYGPTETVVLADDSASPARCAAELLAQAEHDELASPLLLTPSPALAREVSQEVERQLPGLERQGIARQALEGQGSIVLAADLEEAVDFINGYAPEHLSLMVADPWALLGKVRHAGAIFVGGGEALGDYVAGPSHCLPTGGSARFFSPLSVEDFLKVSAVVAPSGKAAAESAAAAVAIARSEGLTAHAAAIEMWLKDSGEKR